MKNRNCRKCGEHIPCRIKIGEIFHNLGNRKFCLKCSPWGSHNTNSVDPDIIPRAREWKHYSEKQKQSVKDCLYRRAKKRKQELIDMLGGKCCKCGYDKSMSAFDFHHKNPKEKMFGLTLNQLWSKNWDSILKEVKKCELLCSNCHRELNETWIDPKIQKI